MNIGLHEQQQAWSYITEDEYKTLCKSFTPSILPTMAISTIKYDENGNPKRAKYRIVALGNLDPYEWTKDQCFAPVLSHLELRLFLSLAIKYKQIAKNCDIKQAFCQTVLPPDDKICSQTSTQLSIHSTEYLPSTKENIIWLKGAFVRNRSLGVLGPESTFSNWHPKIADKTVSCSP